MLVRVNREPCSIAITCRAGVNSCFISAGSFVNLFVYHLMWKDFQVKLRSLFCGKSQQARSEHKTQISTINSGTLDNHNSTQITVTFEIPSQ